MITMISPALDSLSNYHASGISLCAHLCSLFHSVLSSVRVFASACLLISGSRFMVRDFQYNEVEMKADKEEMTRLSTDKKKQFVCVLFFPLLFSTLD